MSKVDALRAMREARFASYQAKPAAARPAAEKPRTEGADEAPAARAKAARPAKSSRKVETVALPATDATEPGAEPEAALCGHRNMSGKECSRPAGHAEKNHRYR